MNENEEDSGKRPLRIFVDANTIVSGLLFEGNEALLLRLGRIGLCRLVTTRYVIDEATQVLRSKEFQLSDEEIISFLSYVNKCALVYQSVKRRLIRKYYARLRDKKDLHVLAALHELDCDMLVTGDKELLRKVTRARTTREALEELLGRSSGR